MQFQKLCFSTIALTLLPALLTQPGWGATSQADRKAAPSSQQSQSEQAAIRARLAALKAFATSGDAVGMAKLWTEDGNYIDDEGNEYTGRSAVEKNFARAFQGNGKRQVDVIADSIRIAASDIALVDGTVREKYGVESIPVTRCSLVFAKKNGEWLISSATETPIVEHAVVNPLQCLNWLIGNWMTEHNGAVVRMKANWVPSKKFILCIYEIQKPEQPIQMESQIIGWDPRSQKPLSWNFDSSGGFSHGAWVSKDNQWLVETTGVERDGSLTSSTDVFTNSNANSFSWQSVHRKVNAVSAPDTQPLIVKRLVN